MEKQKFLVSEEVLSLAYKVADKDQKKEIESLYLDQSRLKRFETEVFKFDSTGFTVDKRFDLGRSPLVIGDGLVSENLRDKSLVLSPMYDLEVLERESIRYNQTVLVFKKKSD